MPENWTAVQRKAAGFLAVPDLKKMGWRHTHCACEAGHAAGGIPAFANVMGDDDEARAEGIKDLRLIPALIMFFYNRIEFKMYAPASALRATV